MASLSPPLNCQSLTLQLFIEWIQPLSPGRETAMDHPEALCFLLPCPAVFPLGEQHRE